MSETIEPLAELFTQLLYLTDRKINSKLCAFGVRINIGIYRIELVYLNCMVFLQYQFISRGFSCHVFSLRLWYILVTIANVWPSCLDIIAYSEIAVRNNSAVVEYCRISMAALSGGTAGLLGLTGLYGFGFYIFAVISLWVSLVSSLICMTNCSYLVRIIM